MSDDEKGKTLREGLNRLMEFGPDLDETLRDQFIRDLKGVINKNGITN